MRSLVAISLALLLLVAVGAKAGTIAEVFRVACIAPLLDGTRIGTHPSLGPPQIVPPTGSDTGRQWSTVNGFLLSEQKTNGRFVGCTLDRFGAGSGPVIITGTEAEAALLWYEFELITAELTRAGTFETRSTEELEGARMIAIQSTSRNPRDRIVAALIYHDLASNYAFLFAGENED